MKLQARTGINREGILGASWLLDRMHFVVCDRKGTAISRWECEAKIEDLGTGALDLPAILKEAVSKTKYRGKEAALVLDHEKLTQQLMETPPTTGKDLELYVQRQVDEIKVIDEDVVCSWQETQPIKMAKGLVLYLFPKLLQQRLYEDCREAGLHLVTLVSPTALLREQLSHLPLNDEDIALLAAKTGENSAVVAGHKEGPVFVGRSLRCNWQREPERLASQINRSIVFIKQQFDVDVGSVWFVGEGAAPYVEAVKPEMTLPLNLSPAEFSPFHWAELAAMLPPDDATNLINKELRLAPKRKVFVRVTTLLVGLQVLLSVGVSTLIEAQVRNEVKNAAALKPRAADLDERKALLQKHFDDLDKQRALLKVVADGTPDPIPYWFLNYVADIIPDELLLTQLQVKRKADLPGGKDPNAEDMWIVRIEGAGRAMAQASSKDVEAAFSKLTDELSNGPFHLSVMDKTDDFTSGDAFRGSTRSKWTVNGTRPAEEDSNPFFVEGIMRGNRMQ